MIGSVSESERRRVVTNNILQGGEGYFFLNLISYLIEIKQSYNDTPL